MPESVAEWVDAYRVAWETRDPEAAASLFTSDASYREKIVEAPYHGRDGVRTYWSSVTASQDEVRVRMGRPFAAGDRVAVEFWTTMKVDSEAATIAGCLLLDFTDEWLCRRLREYWHFLPGHHEPPEEWGQ